MPSQEGSGWVGGGRWVVGFAETPGLTNDELQEVYQRAKADAVSTGLPTCIRMLRPMLPAPSIHSSRALSDQSMPWLPL